MGLTAAHDGTFRRQYRICETGIVFCSGPELPEEWGLFSEPEETESSIRVDWNLRQTSVYQVDFPEPASGEHILKFGSGLMFADRDWENTDLYAECAEQASPLLVLLLCSHLAFRRGMLLHSSLVDYNGSGILFLGPSGIGKTTQAELWNKFLGADILNGDMVFVRENPDGFYGYGSPWHGSSPYCRNKKVKLRALVTLEQAPENTLTKASGIQKLGSVMQQVYLPSWDEKAAEACLDTLNDLLEQVPVYHLACRPDKDSVKILQTKL